MPTPGLSQDGFTPLMLSEQKAAIEADLQARLGTALDLSSTSVLGNLTGIVANALADVWAAAADVYGAQFPAGASGRSLDNILSINNLTRLPAKASVTNPAVVSEADGTTKHGLVLLGTPGTLVPAGSLFTNGAAAPATFSLDQAVTIGTASNASQVLYLGSQPTAGQYSLALTAPGGQQVTCGPIDYRAQPRTTQLLWATAPNSGSFVISIGTAAATSLSFDASTAAIQAAVSALAGQENVTVQGSAQATGGISLAFPLGISVSRVTCAGSAAANTVVDCVAAWVNTAAAADGTLPFTDVDVGGSQQAVTLAFGAFAPQQGQPSTAAVAVPRLAIASSSLFAGSDSVSLTPQTLVAGNPARGIGQATCTAVGDVTVLAGQLATIMTPVNGLSGVTNELDVLEGRLAETDNEALARLRAQQGSASSGSLGAILERVKAVAGVTQVVGAQNNSNAAQQVIAFALPPSTGSFNILLGGQVTSLLSYSASAGDVQQAVRQLPTFEGTIVTTQGAGGYAVSFADSRGGQGLGLAQFPTNTTGQALAAYYGRAAHAVEITAQGGDDAAIAQAIQSALPAGIGTYSTPLARTAAQIAAKSAVITVASAAGIEVGQSVEGACLPLGVQVAGIAGTSITLTAAANYDGSQVPVVFDRQVLVQDVAGNPVSVAFSRPQTAEIFVSLRLVTDQAQAGGQFNPASVSLVKQGIIDAINAVPIGGTIVVLGTQGLLNSFRSVPGITSASMTLGRSPGPTETANIALSANEAPLAQDSGVSVSIS